MKEISLTQGQIAKIDDDDFEIVSRYKWCAARDPDGRFYAISNPESSSKPGRKQLRMHRLITNCPPHLQVDHLNHDCLDNRKVNLRICDVRGNAQNRLDHTEYGPGIRDVRLLPSRSGYLRAFEARIFLGGKLHSVGHFNTPDEASTARAHFLHAYEFSCALSGRVER